MDRGFVLPLQVPQLVNRGRAPRARPYFDPADYQIVSRNLREFAKTGHKKSSKMLRTLRWDYALILANTGVRTDREALNLKWSQINRATEIDERSPKREKINILKFSVVGKKRPRILICRNIDGNVSTLLKHIQDRFSDLQNLSNKGLVWVDQYLFSTADGTRPVGGRLGKAFQVPLTKYDLFMDKKGRSERFTVCGITMLPIACDRVSVGLTSQNRWEPVERCLSAITASSR